MKPIVSAALGAVFLCLLLTPIAAGAQRICLPHDRLAATLAERFGETQTASGLDARGNLVEVFSSTGGSWSIVVSAPGGLSCIVAAGKGWRQTDAGPEGAES